MKFKILFCLFMLAGSQLVAHAQDVSLGQGQSVTVTCDAGAGTSPMEFRSEVDSACYGKIYWKNSISEKSLEPALDLITAALEDCRAFVPAHPSCVKIKEEMNAQCWDAVKLSTFFDSLDTDPKFIKAIFAACKTNTILCKI